MSTVVLVHGSFSGGWIWQQVAPALRDAGHDVFTPTLTGLGERRHLVGPRIGLDVHVQDIVGVIEANELTEVALLGHSYGGMVITGAAEHCAERIAQLVYFDGFVPEDGQSCWDIVPETRPRWEAGADSTGTDWLCPPPDPSVKNVDIGEETAEWLHRHKSPMPLWTHAERIQIPENRAADLPRTYISCTRYETFQSTAQRAREADFEYYELDTGHSAMVIAPNELVDILLDSIGDPSD